MSNNNNLNFTDLVLLIGTNPLPNYVVAKYFLENVKKLKRIIMVFSGQNESNKQESTIKYVKILKKLIEGNYKNIEIKTIKLDDIGNSVTIDNDIKKQFKVEDNLIYHLNYTGGTKAMAVHVYRTLEEQFGEKNKSGITFSYLDARENKIIVDGQASPLNEGDLREEVKIGVDELLFIHDKEEEINKEPEYIDYLLKDKDNRFFPLMKAFENLINAGKIDEFNNWVRKNQSYKDFVKVDGEEKERQIDLLDNPPSGLIKNAEELIKNCHKGSLSKDLVSLLSAFPDSERLCDKDGNLIIDNFKISGKANEQHKKFKGFLTGMWLEAYVYYILEKLIEKGKLTNSEIAINKLVKITEEIVDGEDYSEEAEIDVMVMNGYQLTGISCTKTTDYKVLRNKGFEVIHRTTQIGGEEARAVLVTLKEKEIKGKRNKNEKDAKDLFNNLSKISGRKGGNLLVLGIEDLKTNELTKQLKAFIWEK